MNNQPFFYYSCGVSLMVAMQFFFLHSSITAQPIETSVQTGHYASVEAVASSPDGRFIATGSVDKSVILWRCSDGREVRPFIGNTSTITSIVFNHQGTCLLSLCRDGNITIWDMNTGKIIRQFTLKDDEFTCASFHPSENIFVAGTKKSGVSTWDIATGEKLSDLTAVPVDLIMEKNFEYKETRTITYSNDGKYIIAGAGDKTVILWNAETGKEENKFKRDRYTCTSCLTMAYITSDNKYILSAASDSVHMFDRISGKLIRSFYNNNGRMDAISASPDDRFMAALQYGRVELWDLKSGKHLRQTRHEDKRITTVCFSSDSKYLITGNEKRTADIWRLADGERIMTLRGYLNQLDERLLDYSFMHWAALVYEMKLSPDNRYIAVGRTGSNAKLIDFKTGRIFKTLTGHNGMIISLNFSNDSRYLATGGIDGKAILWDVSTGRSVREFRYGDSTLAIFSVDISPDNKLLATADWAGYVVIWDTETGKIVQTLYPHSGNASYHVKFSANGLYIISAGLDKKLKLIEIDSGEEIRTFIGHTDLVTSINLHPTSENIITAGRDNTIRVWDFFSGLQLQKIKAHEGGIFSARYDSTGKYIVSGGNDNQVTLWNAENGTRIADFDGHRGAIGDAHMTKDNQFIISGSRDGSIRVWSVAERKELVAMIFMNENDWFVKTPGGYFDASEGAYNSISFVKGTELYSIDQFFNEFYRPGVYPEAIFGKTGFREDVSSSIESFPPPSIEIVSPEENTQMENSLATFLVKVTNNGGGVKELKVMHNGKRQPVDDENLLRMNREGQYDIKTFDISLVPGENEISVSAFSKGEIESKPVSIKLFYKGLSRSSDCYVLSIGINKYANDNLNLNFARPDAEALTDVIKDKGSKLFSRIYTYPILDGQATREKILATLDEISGKIGKEDVFVFFYAGHGSTTGDNFWFITTESTGLYQEEKMKSAIDVKELQDRFKMIRALKQVIFVDACHSGSSVDLLAMRGAQEEKALAQLSRSSGIHVMASAESRQQSAEIKSLQHGVFTYVLLEAIQGKADGAPQDNKITIYEIKSYIDDQVPEISYRLIRHRQFPSTFSIGHDFPLVVE
ncbi:MAG: caspase family protein [Bacteroidales bacterium]|nr:caspase family protein [Bacteroidales bacterium]